MTKVNMTKVNMTPKFWIRATVRPKRGGTAKLRAALSRAGFSSSSAVGQVTFRAKARNTFTTCKAAKAAHSRLMKALRKQGKHIKALSKLDTGVMQNVRTGKGYRKITKCPRK